MQWKLHVRFEGRAGETHRSKDDRALRSDPYTVSRVKADGVPTASSAPTRGKGPGGARPPPGSPSLISITDGHATRTRGSP